MSHGKIVLLLCSRDQTEVLSLLVISTKYLNELLVLTLSARMPQRSDRQSWLEPWRPLEPGPSFVTAQEGLIVMTESLFRHKQRGYLKVRVIIKTMIS